MDEEKEFSEKESLQLIHEMISKAKASYHETGIGPILWGSVITFCSLVTFAQVQFSFNLPFDIWLLTLVAIIPQVIISVKESRKRKAVTYEDKAMSYIWTCFGISIFLLVNININLFAHLNPILNDYEKLKGIADAGFNYNSYSTSLFLLLYGIPTIITGGITCVKPMLYGGILCWVCCIISVYTGIKTDLLLMALSATAMWLIPGIILRRRFVAKKKEMNV